jgi:hypothetical protein
MTAPKIPAIVADETRERERQLDEALEATFPASDPVALSYPTEGAEQEQATPATDTRQSAA